jgi:homogentisate 1,2-dioxygenase
LDIQTEFGGLNVGCGDIAVIQRGMKFSVGLLDSDSPARGFVCEIFKGHFLLPELGPLGANGLANPYDVIAIHRVLILC